jgi:uncharacterized membrane protein YjjB (DUF3815 family)
MNALDLFGVIAQDALLSAVAATGFAMVFSAPRRTLLGCAIGGALGHASRLLLMQLGLEIELATLAGSVVIGVVGVLLAQRLRAPTPIFTISAGVTLVPGVFAYQTMIGILQVAAGDPEAAAAALVAVSANGIKTALILGAIAVGIAAPTLLFDRRKPVV